MTPTTKLDPRLKEWATPQQAQFIDAVNAHGGVRPAARALRVAYSTIAGAVARAAQKAAAHGWSPQHDYTHPVPDTHVAKGVSTLYDEHGKVRLQWVKSSLDAERWEEAKQAALAALAEELPRLPPMRSPAAACKSALCNLYTLTDCHVGMLAWGRETGAPWDLRIAEETLTKAFEHMVANSPRAATAIVNQLGDFMHYDSLAPVTPTHGHVLDADGRFGKMVEVAIRVLRRVIDFALARHEKVVVLLAEGNHDMASSVWLRKMFRTLYENEPRIEVIDSESPYYCYRHGATMLAFHHGHLRKKEQLPLTMAAKFPEAWGRTTHRYCHVGHQHHIDEKEHKGIVVQQHRTLAASDAHSARLGYVSGRQVTAVTYHDRFGEVARTVVTPEMLEASP